ncbi:DNA-protecting protein DprA [Thalassotalea sp. M1531]|uniref:DNA-protecting protein DprA n=1 Tax=Thalassotalea algicola TaxID=2716224 RepID=A0A7Y0LAT4_9GAMM|nr:DNA-processing protein DprA [Thalassotalea algicola]NMP30824.1 DNA-protecting protein DprA [Thalassotalea algicola]
MVKDEYQLWLALKLVPRLSIKRKLALVDTYGIVGLFQLTTNQLKSIGLNNKQISAITRPDRVYIDNILNQTEQFKSQLIHFGSPSYPKLLKEIYDPPLLLWVKGDTRLLNLTQIAMVGSRSATGLGRELAMRISSELANVAVVTSGMALGIDAACHQGALAVSGKTIAVIGTGIDKIYPARHKPLAKSIVEEGGAIVSEFIPGTHAKPGHFPRRNRIISGLSLGTVVVEAEIKSGSLVTAKIALEQNRDVFAVPGSPVNPMASGCNQLIKQGAKLIDCAADIVEELGIAIPTNFNKQPVEKSVKIREQGLLNETLLASVDYEVTPVDIVISRSKLPTDEVLTRLTMLELRGLVSAVPGGYLRLHRG